MLGIDDKSSHAFPDHWLDGRMLSAVFQDDSRSNATGDEAEDLAADELQSERKLQTHSNVSIILVLINRIEYVPIQSV